MNTVLDADITFLKGVGTKRADLLISELGIKTYKDLLYYFPYKYLDRSKIYKINEVKPDMGYIQIKVKVVKVETLGAPRKQRLVVTVSDGTGYTQLLWFKGIKWIAERIKPNVEYIVFGKPSEFNGRINFTHPELEDAAKKNDKPSFGLQGMYNTTEKMKTNFLNSKAIHNIVVNLMSKVHSQITETLPAHLIEEHKLMYLKDALYNIHLPKNHEFLQKAIFRLKFEELFYIQLKILKHKYNHDNYIEGYHFRNVGQCFNDFYKKCLPFELTNAQKRVLREIRKDTNIGKQMNRLLQGDVGSGKTLVALMSMLLAIDNGFQACMMVPTEILANQHFETITEMLKPLDVQVALLTGSTKQSQRRQIHEQLINNEIKILIGTHALIEDSVQFSSLGFVVIDEQHRFGVAQRAKLRLKNRQVEPHVLIMTATPIPRTLAMTLYGDLDVSVIDELPPGRKPIRTYHYNDSKRLRLFGFMKEQIAQGRQIYVVYPLIKESEALDYKNLEEGLEAVSRAFPPPQYSISVVHGKMPPANKDISMDLFVRKQAQIMVATTVIEVGVNVPNATVMVIESAERFGLSQLHQLRGRVGRGADQSFCILMTGNKLTTEARTRMETMVNTNDGFKIAEVDMKLRGPGDIDGTQQSGIPLDLKIANLSKDNQIIEYTRRIASEIINADPNLDLPQNAILQSEMQRRWRYEFDWSKIS